MLLLQCLGFGVSKNTSLSKKHYTTVIEELCRQFSWEDLRKSTNNFDKKLIIGRGGFGTVYKGCLKHDCATDYAIALKRLDRYSSQGSHEFEKEIELLCQLRHPNLVSLIGFYSNKMEKIIVYEYMPNGSLYDHLYCRDMEPLSWKKRLEICIGVARGLHYLHTGAKRIIIHRDIKPMNILLDTNMAPKLLDFRLCMQGPLSMSKPKPIEVDVIAGTVGYLAPEQLLHGTLTDKCDVYSFGMVLLEMVCTTDRQTFINKANKLMNQQLEDELLSDPIIILNKIYIMKHFPIEEMIDQILEGKIASKCWEVFLEITQRCLQEEPDERPTMGEVEVLLELALSLQEEADITRTNGDYTLLSTTYIDMHPTIYIDGEELCRQFSLVDLKQTTYNFNERRVISRGSFGTVYKGHIILNDRTRHSIAILRLEWSSICERENQWNFGNEIESICQLRHPNLISLIGFCDDNDEKILVYIYYPYESFHYCQQYYLLSWKKRLENCIGAAQGLEHLHKAAICHRNIKLNNILLDMEQEDKPNYILFDANYANYVPKLLDFGFPWSKPIHAEGYAAPEWLQGHDFTYKCDVYSFGVVLLQMVSGKETPIIKVDIDPKLKGKIAPRCWEVFLDITRRCLKFDANERPTMNEVKAQLQHALALQEEADANNTSGYYSLPSYTFEAQIGGS